MGKRALYDWNDVALSLIVVDLDIRWWRGISRVSLGSLRLAKGERKYQQFLNKVVLLGFKRFMPKRCYSKLNSLDVSARELLRSYSYPTVFGYLMPKEAYVAWKEKIAAVQDEFYEVRDEILSQWDNIIREREEEYEKNIRLAWELEIKGKSDKAAIPGELVNKVLELLRAWNTIPSVQTIYNSFGFEWNVSYLEPTTSLTLGEKIIEQRRLEFKRLHITHSLEDIKIITRQNNEEEKFHREIISKVRTEREAKVRTALEQIAVYIPQMIYDSVLDSLVSINRNFNKRGENYVIGRVSLGLSNLMEKVHLLNFSQNRVINNLVCTIEEAVISKKPGQRNIEDTVHQLYALVSKLREYLISLGKIPRPIPSLDIYKDIQPIPITSLSLINRNITDSYKENPDIRRCVECHGPLADMNKDEKCYSCQGGVYYEALSNESL